MTNSNSVEGLSACEHGSWRGINPRVCMKCGVVSVEMPKGLRDQEGLSEENLALIRQVFSTENTGGFGDWHWNQVLNAARSTPPVGWVLVPEREATETMLEAQSAAYRACCGSDLTDSEMDQIAYVALIAARPLMEGDL